MQISNCFEKTTDPEIEAEKQRLYDEVIGNFEEFLNENGDLPSAIGGDPKYTQRMERGQAKLCVIDPDDLIESYLSFLIFLKSEDFADYLGEVLAFDYAFRTYS